MPRFAQRRDQLAKLVRKTGAPAILVTSETNVTYLTGFTGDSSYLLLTRGGPLVLSDARYTTQLEEECPGLEVVIRRPGTKMLDAVARTVKSAGLSSLAVEAHALTVDALSGLSGRLPGLDFVNTRGLVEQLREIKDKQEIREIRDAIRLAERAFGVIRAGLRAEQTEKELADALEHQVRLFGGRCTSFPPIVAVGDRAALPHYRPGDLPIGQAGFVLVDWGARGNQYVSDLTRLLVTGKVPARLEKIYGVVLAAQQKAIAKIRPGVPMEEIDAAARGVIAAAGYGKRFGHSLGHGIGLQIHEGPWLREGEKRTLKAGMVVTVEPGVYVPGFGGVRIEDDVLVTRDGCEVLSSLSRDWADCPVAARG